MFSNHKVKKENCGVIIHAAIYFLLLVIPPVFAVDVNDLEILPKHILTSSGYSQDLALNPVDGTLHIVWVNSAGDIKYTVRYPDGTWSNTQTIPDKGLFVVGIEEPATNRYPRKCISIAIDEQGMTHIIFADSDGEIYYLNGYPGSWSTPVLIVDKVNPSIWLDIAVVNGARVVTWEDEGTEHVFTIMYRQGQWKYIENMGWGENPSLCTGSENRIYLISRDYGDPYNVKLWYLTAGDAVWHFVSPVTNASVRLGHGPQMAVYNKKMYISWPNSNRFTTDKDKKGELFVAASEEPGLEWIPRLGGVEPLYYDNTADTHGRVAIYSDGVVLHMNGGRDERFQIWGGTSWSLTRRAPWGDEDDYSEKKELEVVCDGQTAWIISSLANSNNGEVALYGIKNPEGEIVIVPGQNPVDKLEIVAKHICDTGGFSCDIAVNPASGALHAAWVKNGDIYFSSRQTNGTWSVSESIPDGGQNVYSSDQSVPRNCLGIDVDQTGMTHLVFAAADGDLYYVSGSAGHWNVPSRIVDKSGSTIFPDIVCTGDHLTVIYEDADTDRVYSLQRSQNVWSAAELIGNGDYPCTRSGSDGRVYMAYRRTGEGRNAVFGTRIPGFTPWTPTDAVTDAENELGGSPGMAVAGSSIYLSWNNNTGIEFSENSSQLFCAQAPEPGSVWNSRFDTTNPLFLENVSDPHPRVEVYSDGEILYLNGRGVSRQYVLWDKDQWSQTRTGPWLEGVPAVASDGKIIWIGVSSASSLAEEVSVTGIRNPDAFRYNFTNNWPIITSSPVLNAQEGLIYTYSVSASDQDEDPLTYQLVQKPDGMTISAAGLVQWTPSSAQGAENPWNKGMGIHLVGIKASDNKNRSDLQWYWIQVTSTNHPPDITTTPVTSVNYGNTYNYLVGAQDLDGETLSFSLTQCPAGMTIGSSGLITWTPQFGDIGTHPVAVRVTDPRGGYDTQSFTIQVVNTYTKPEAVFSAQPTEGICPLEVHFINQSTGSYTFSLWDFGDDQISTETNPVHTYTSEGTYTVRLTITGPGGSGLTTIEQMIRTYASQPNHSPEITTAPVTSVNYGNTYNYLVVAQDLDGETLTFSLTECPSGMTIRSTGVIVWTPQVQDTGAHPVTVQVSDPRGGYDTQSFTIQVINDVTKPVSAFSAQPTEGIYPLEVHFINQSTGSYTFSLWDFGDGEISTEIHPVHTFTSEGNYTVSLVVTGPGGSGLTIKEQMIQVHPSTSVTQGPVPDGFNFYPIAPNPFNPSTLIVYDVPRTSEVQVSVYDVCGRRMILLTDEEKQAGRYSIVWDGIDGFGRRIPSGIYFIVMESGDFRSQQKALFMK